MRILSTLAACALSLGLLAAPHSAAQSSVRGLWAFSSDKQLKAFIAERRQSQRREKVQSYDLAVPAPPPPAMVAPSAADAGDVVVTASKMESNQESSVAITAVSSENITNRQEAEVDEGGIVKVHGDHLVVLRRGRLFTVSVGDAAMRPIAYTNAFPPGKSGQGAWYDEMLIAGDRVIVVGYSYARGGTEINRFTIGRDGSLRYDDTHHLTSDDYYSSRNYASRLIGTKLIFYTPLSFRGEDIIEALPGVRRWRGDDERDFRRIAPARQIYVAEPVRRRRDAAIDTLHSVTTCDLAAAELDCNAMAVLGSSGRTFYVSGSAVYVWVDEAFSSERYRSRSRSRPSSQSLVYRLPLDGSRPSAVMTWGGPVDQFSFREDKRDGVLNVVVRAESGGDRMWRSEVSDGATALLRLPLDLFGDGSQLAGRALYRSLPRPNGDDWSFHNRYVGRHLLYSGGALQERENSAQVFAVPLSGGATRDIAVPHGVDRLEALGNDAVSVGGARDGSLGFTAIDLGGGARKGDTFRLPTASEGENRSHAFFFRADTPDGASGLMGLPVSRRLEGSARRFLGDGSAILFLARNDRRFARAGELEAAAANARDDACQASCVDWYGNARPIFLRGRVFALMGYELVEGAMRGGRISEVRRVNFAPGSEGRR